MKKMVLAVLVLSMVITACGAPAEVVETVETVAETESQNKVEETTVLEVSSETQDEVQSESDTEDNPIEDIGKIETEQGLFNVTLTIPASMVGEGKTQEDLDVVCKEKGYKSATLNDDGSVTYVITKAQHQEMMEGIKQSIQESLDDMVNGEDYPNFKEITVKDDYSEFDVQFSGEKLSLTESMAILAFRMYGAMYNIFNGTECDDYIVRFYNSETGELIKENHSKEE